MKVARGEYITFLDDDDYFFPERLQILIKELEKHQEYNAAYSSLVVTQRGRVRGDIVAEKSGNLKKALLLNEVSLGAGSNMVFRAQYLKEIGGFDESFNRHQDIELMLRFLENNKILACKQYLAVLVQDDRSNELDIEKYGELKKHYFTKFEKQISLLSKKEKNKFYISNYLSLLIVAIKNKRTERVKEIKEILEKYNYNKIKLNLKILMYYGNNILKFSKVKYTIKRIQVNFLLTKEQKEYIKKTEGII